MSADAVIKSGSHWQGRVVSVGPTGNLITNFRSDEVRPLAQVSKMWMEFEKASATLRGLSQSPADAAPGKLVAFEGAGGTIEIAVNQGNASTLTQLSAGDRVDIYFRA